MRSATIFLAQRYGGGGAFADAVGAELRELRLRRHLTQKEVAAPLTSAYVSAVEHGRVFPSLPALAMMCDRLGVELAEYFAGVNSRLRRVYTDKRD